MSSIHSEAQGRFLAHEPCPKCQKAGKDRRGDNLGRWEDGHAFCFSCQYYEESPATKLLANVANATKGQPGIRPSLSLPSDYEKNSFPIDPLQWLGKYDIMREEIIENDIGYSKDWNALIFPIRGAAGGPLLAFQARRFNQDRKWTTHGDVVNLNHILGWKHTESPIVIVEDIVSAIKVARHTRSMPVFGSHISANRLNRLRYITKSIVLWLDGDKYAEAIRAASRANLLGIEQRVIYTEKDPKEYNDEEIKRLLRT